MLRSLYSSLPSPLPHVQATTHSPLSYASHPLHSTPALSSSHTLLNRCFQRGRVRAHDRVSQFAVFKDHESRHGAHAELLRYVGDGVDVDFVEAHFFVGVGEPAGRSSD